MVFIVLKHTQAHTDSRLSGLAANQLSAIVAPGAREELKLRK